MTEKHLVFIDESGNAGSNLLDNQPVLAIAGVAARETSERAMSEAIRGCKSHYGFQPQQEIKAADLIRHPKNALMIEIAELILSEGLPIVAVVVERRFMTTALIVDDLFDPVYNHKVGNEWTQPIPIKPKLANHFYDHLRDETIALAGRALTSGNRAEIEELISRIENDVSPFRLHDGLDIVETIQGAKYHTQQLSEVIQAISKRGRKRPVRTARGTVRSPNMPAFFDLMMRVEYMYEHIPDADVRLIFDSSAQFDKSFADLVSAGITSGPAKLIFPDSIPLTFGFKSIKSFSVSNSASSPLLQIADFYATGIRRTFDLCLLQDQPDNINEASLFFLAFVASILFSDLYNFIISDNLTRRFWLTLQKYEPAN